MSTINKPSNLFAAAIGLSLSLLTSTVFADIQSQVVWAVNLGGEAFRADDSLQYQADNCTKHNDCRSVAAVEGTQIQPLYKSYRTGNLRFSRPLNNGIYDLTLHFMEPEDISKGERRFNVLAQGNVVIGDLDSLSPDIRAALASDTQIIELLGQDDTDLEKALQRIVAPLIIGLAFLEARFDHSLAALHALMRLGHDRPVMLVGAHDVLVRVKGDFSATLPVGSRFSIWPLGRQKFSQSRGLKWPLDGLDMAAGKVIGTSNQVSDSTVEITASTGDGYAVIMSLRHMPALLNAVT